MLSLLLLMALAQVEVQQPCRNADAMAAKTKEIIGRVQPLMNERRAILQQLSSVQSSNPLSRSFKSMFDKNKDPEHLKARYDLLTEQIETEVESGKMELQVLKLGC